MSTVLMERQGRVGVLTLNRPEQLNALNDTLMDSLGAALLELDADDGIGAIVITGSDKAFAAGADIAAMADWGYMDVFSSNFITRNWETIRQVRKPVIAAVAGFAMGGPAMVADDAQHVVLVALISRKCPQFGRHFGAGRISDPGHDGGQRPAQGAAFVAVIAKAHVHQEAADIGIAKAQRAEVIGQLCNFFRRELRHHHRDLKHHGPKTDSVLEGGDVELARCRVTELQQVQRGEVAGRVVQEHVFRARVRRADVAGRLAAEAVVPALAVIDVERGRLFLMEGARRPPVALGHVRFAQVPCDLAAHHLAERHAVAEFVDESGWQGHGFYIGPRLPLVKGR